MELGTNRFTPAKWILEVDRIDDKVYIYLNDIPFFSHEGQSGGFGKPKSWDLEGVAREALRRAYLVNDDEDEIQKLRTQFASFMDGEDLRLKLRVVNFGGPIGISYKLLKDGIEVAGERVFVPGKTDETREIEFEIVRFRGDEFLRVISKFG